MTPSEVLDGEGVGIEVEVGQMVVVACRVSVTMTAARAELKKLAKRSDCMLEKERIERVK